LLTPAFLVHCSDYRYVFYKMPTLTSVTPKEGKAIGSELITVFGNDFYKPPAELRFARALVVKCLLIKAGLSPSLPPPNQRNLAEWTGGCVWNGTSTVICTTPGQEAG
jgi:hypothetical protein